MKRLICSGLAGITLLTCVTFLVAKDPASSSSLPDAVTKLVQQHFPSATIVDTDIGDDDDLTEYRVRVKLPAGGRGARLEIREDIGVTSIEEQMRQEQLPPRLQKALQHHFPGAKFRDAHKNSEVRVTYQVDLVINGKRSEVTLSPRGKVLEVD